jgi:hypothetical protein
MEEKEVQETQNILRRWEDHNVWSASLADDSCTACVGVKKNTIYLRRKPYMF